MKKYILALLAILTVIILVNPTVTKADDSNVITINLNNLVSSSSKWIYDESNSRILINSNSMDNIFHIIGDGTNKNLSIKLQGEDEGTLGTPSANSKSFVGQIILENVNIFRLPASYPAAMDFTSGSTPIIHPHME